MTRCEFPISNQDKNAQPLFFLFVFFLHWFVSLHRFRVSSVFGSCTLCNPFHFIRIQFSLGLIFPFFFLNFFFCSFFHFINASNAFGMHMRRFICSNSIYSSGLILVLALCMCFFSSSVYRTWCVSCCATCVFSSVCVF